MIFLRALVLVIALQGLCSYRQLNAMNDSRSFTLKWHFGVEDITQQCEQETELHWAAERGDFRLVARLIGNCRSQPEVLKFIAIQGLGGYTALHYAAHFGHIEVVKAIIEVIIEAGGNPSDFISIKAYRMGKTFTVLDVAQWQAKRPYDLWLDSWQRNGGHQVIGYLQGF